MCIRDRVKAVEEAAAKPENKDIVAKIRKESKNDSIFRREWARIPGAPNPRTFGFDKKGENDADLANDSLGAGWLKYHQYYMAQPAVDKAVSYTHLDVYKRQKLLRLAIIGLQNLRVRIGDLEAAVHIRHAHFGDDVGCQ